MPNTYDLSGRTVLVTGGAQGLGRSIAEQALASGATVCIADLRNSAEVGKEIGVYGVDLDVSDPAAVEAGVAAALEHLGRIDVLVNNAGTTWAASPEDTTLAGWQKVMDVNLTGVFLFAQAAGRVMLAQGRGKIINIASILATRGAPPDYVDAIAYNTSKGGVLTFTKDLAVKWGPRGVHVNGIAPGWFPSGMSDKAFAVRGERLRSQIPLGRFGSSHDLKGAVVFLASDASDFVLGHTLAVDGGDLAQ